MIAALKVDNQGNQGKQNGSRKTGHKPSAPWRTEAELNDLRERKVCLRCERPGHHYRFCRLFGPPTRPANINNINGNGSDSVSGKD
ncbi:hypothetical protein K3495_g16381 [Podosphaera aphanis]|nr:hypothetical protein K3495_g16381 [Podosphaera aphanis]